MLEAMIKKKGKKVRESHIPMLKDFRVLAPPPCTQGEGRIKNVSINVHGRVCVSRDLFYSV